MPRTQVRPDTASLSAQAVGAAFSCALGDDGRGAAWVRVSGELDGVTAPRLAQTLGQAARCARLVVVDLRGLTRVDVSGVGAIADASRGARRDGRRLVLVRGLSQGERLLALTGALDAVEIIELAAGAPTILALLQIARKDRAESRQRTRVPRRVSTLLRPGQINRGVGALIARGIRHDFIDG